MDVAMRGFTVDEYRSRLARAQSAMAKTGLAALLLTCEPDVRYFSGFLTRFWESPTRPWFLIVPAKGDPVAVIPSIGVALMARTWIKDIRSWRSPDLHDEGVSLLAETLREIVGVSGEIGLPIGHESHLRMPLADYHRLAEALGPIRLCSDDGILRALRIVKSEAEIAKIARACGIADRAFACVPEIAAPGVGLDEVFRRFQMLCLEEGADWVPYLAGAASPGGYDDVISPATERPLADGDVLMLDTGLVWDGYFCDFDRNFAIGHSEAESRSGPCPSDRGRPGGDGDRPARQNRSGSISHDGPDRHRRRGRVRCRAVRPWARHATDRMALADPAGSYSSDGRHGVDAGAGYRGRRRADARA